MKTAFTLAALLFCASAAFSQDIPATSSDTAVQAAPATPAADAAGTAPAETAAAPAAEKLNALPGMKPGDEAETSGEGPWEVAEISVKGCLNVKPKVIMRTGKARKGRLYMKSFIDEDIESILGLGSAETVSVELEEIKGGRVSKKSLAAGASTQPVHVTYVVTERPMIKTVTINGAKGLSKGSVKDEMTLKEKDFFDDVKIREDLGKIEDKYRERGYIDAKADFEVKYATSGSVCWLTVNLKEGNKAKVAAVELTGVAGFPQKKLIKQLKNRPKKIYQPKELDSDQKALETFYKNNGYADFKVESSSVSFNPDRSGVTIRLALSEGRRQRFGATFFSGNTVYLPSEFEPDLAYRRGKIYNQERFDDTLRAIQDRYADKGYLRAQITPRPEVNEKTGQTDFTFVIAENTPIYVDHVDVEGNKATKSHVLRREVAQKEGEVFSSSKVRRSQEKLFNLGFLDDVNPVINPTPDPDKVDLIFDVTEGKPGMLTAGAGLSSRDGLVGTVSLSHMNLFGLAHRTSLSWNFGKKVQDYYLSWSMPWIGDHPTTLGVDMFNTRHFKPYREAISAYTERRTGGKVTVAPRFDNDKYHLTTSYTYEKVRISDIDQVYLGELTPGTSVTSSVYVEFARDTRDNIWDATKGCRTSLGLEFTGGPLQGDVDFYKPTLSHSWNKKLFSIDDYPFVLAFSNRFGYATQFGGTKRLPVYERYFLGGADTVRGYANNGQVGPLQGGKVYDVANLEFKFPLARERRRTIVQWAFFMDLGNSWEHFDDVTARVGTRTSNLKAGAGFGIRFTTPAFPIRLDWGYGFNHKPGEQRSDIYFTLGNLF